MEINELNYEMYALDHAEGLLTGAEAEAMEAFLSQHPELREEIGSICATTIPKTPAAHGSLQTLKKKRGIAVLWIGPMRSAIAALLVIGLGVMWFMNQRPVYGELASAQPAFTIHYSIDLTYYDGEEISVPVANPLRVNEQKADKYSLLADTKVDHIPTTIQESVPNFDQQAIQDIPVQDQPSAVDYKVKMKIIEPVDVQSDDYFILPVTIELYDLTLKGAREARSAQDALAEIQATKDARRKLIKEGTLSVLQQKLMPEGLQNLLSN